jgi:drug/metabolite transporter (DMT)-like permease
MSTDSRNNQIIVGLALLAVYIIWGSTYLGIELALNGGYPPMLMGGIRFMIAGVLLLAFLAVRGTKLPTPRQWFNSAIIGILLLVGGNGGVMLAEHWHVSTGLAAVVVAGVGIWAALFSLLFGRSPSKLEWLGLIVGISGVGLLTFQGDLSTNPLGALVLVGGTMCWAFGAVYSQRIDMPKGLMSSAAQMITGGIAFFGLGALLGEQFTTIPTLEGTIAVGYLIVFGSLMGFTAFTYLVQNVKPVLATSYAYVNPIVATLLGIWWLGETITPTGIVAMIVILGGVALIAAGREKIKPPAPPVPAPAQSLSEVGGD